MLFRPIRFRDNPEKENQQVLLKILVPLLLPEQQLFKACHYNASHLYEKLSKSFVSRKYFLLRRIM